MAEGRRIYANDICSDGGPIAPHRSAISGEHKGHDSGEHKGHDSGGKKGTIDAAKAVDQGAPQRQAAPAASSEMEIEQLKKRLNQLEQTAEQLKQQLATLEQTRVTSGAAVGEAVSVPDAVPEIAGKTKADTKAQGKESTFQVYGFAMLDAGYQVKTNDPLWFDVIRPTKLPAFEGEFAPNG